MEAVIQESIDLLYCGDAPKPDWCAILTKIGAKYNIDYKDGLWAVVVSLQNADQARKRAT